MTEEVTNIFTNREVALIIWVLIFGLWVFIKSTGFYKSLWGVLVSATKMWKIFLPMVTYIVSCIFILYTLGFWNIEFIKITTFWFFGWAIIALLNSTKIRKENSYLRRIVFEILGLSIIVTFISGFYSFSLWIELIIVPIVAVFAGMSAVAAYNKEYESVGIFSDWFLGVLGIGVLVISLFRVSINFNNFATLSTLQEFITPILLSLMFLPFMYIVSLYSDWEQRKLQESFKKIQESEK